MAEQITLSPQEAQVLEQQWRIVSKSVDARQRQLKVNLTLLTDQDGKRVPKDAPVPLYPAPVFRDVHSSSKVVYIVGAGPAGLFAALTCLEHGIKPIVFERGKAVSERKKDIALLNRNESFHPESNYCFGEGGAGTFSDGKLFSRSKKRGNMQKVMEWFHYFGAKDNVLYEAHAHIGSDRLPSIIKSMRECILQHGGEIYFETLFHLPKADTADAHIPIIYAIGHSAHDSYRELAHMGVRLEPKGFAMGVRVEHPQSLINDLMYHRAPQSIVDIVGNASYSLVTQVNGRGVYSFCMCPGGHIVPAGSSEGSCVVNGMSASHRNSPFANSGIVVEIRPEDISSEPSWESNLRYQESLEETAFAHAQAYQAPAQCLKDFVEGKQSAFIPKNSYLPGTVSSRLDQWLPAHIRPRLQQGFRDFDRKYHGFLTNQAVILGVESRSSSAIRIPRDKDTLRAYTQGHLIYPAGEGAGYAGGITSSALDGMNIALRIAQDLHCES